MKATLPFLILISFSLIQADEAVNGYVLPPEPDPAINNSTLLGVDSNGNGVRDDVERYIYLTYKKPIEHDVFMQMAKAYQQVIVEPSKARDNVYILDDVVDCLSYYSGWAEVFGEHNLLDEYRDYFKELEPIQFNTAERHKAYQDYNHHLSGGVYSSRNEKMHKSKCAFDTSKYDE